MAREEGTARELGDGGERIERFLVCAGYESKSNKGSEFVVAVILRRFDAIIEERIKEALNAGFYAKNDERISTDKSNIQYDGNHLCYRNPYESV